MNEDEINKTIAGFMGWKFERSSIDKKECWISNGGFAEWSSLPFTDSMDELTPVWEKLGVTSFKCEKRPPNMFQEAKWRFTLFVRDKKSRELGLTQAFSAAHATAQAIKNKIN